MSRLYFDLTNIVRFAENNDHVTGIQRVQLRLIADLVTLYGTDQIRATAYFGPRRGWHEIDPSFLAEQKEFKAALFLLTIGVIRPSRYPSKDQVKRHLLPYNDRKLLRAFKKVGLYLLAACSTSAMRARGFTIYRPQDCPPPRSRPLSTMSPEDTFVILGENWANDDVEQWAIAHHSRGGRVAHMVHDLIPYCRPEFHTDRMVRLFNRWLERSLGYVDTYLCVSKHTAQDLQSFIDRQSAQRDVRVTPLAHEFAGYAREVNVPAPPQLDGKEYVLCVGSVEVRKNGLALLQAWALVRQALGDETPLLVFAGKKGWKVDGFDAFLEQSRNLDGGVLLIPSPSDAELVALYRHCLFTAYPSLYEGWGLPVGEAAWFGKFGIASSESSVPEVCGALMDYADPRSPEDIARQLLRPLQDTRYLATRTQQVREAELRTWRDVAIDVHQQLT